MAPRNYAIIAALCLLIFAAALLSFWDRELGSFGRSSLQDKLVPFSEIKSYDIILDVSPTEDEFIEGAISLSYERLFNEDKTLKPDSQLSQIFGEAGISQDNSVVIYGECQPCGGGPSAATYVYWTMKYLGHRRLGLLEGGISDWKEASLPTEKHPLVRPKTTYISNQRHELVATYDDVLKSKVQIVDARPQNDFHLGSIPASTNIPYDAVLLNGKLKNNSALKSLFAGLDKGRPVVVYTETGVKASMVCYALQMMGYSAKLYTWKDWMSHQASNNVSRGKDPQAGSI